MVLIERDEILTSLEELLADAVAGNGRIAVLTGAVATGKSELLQAFAGRAIDHGARSLTATGSRTELALPLALLSQLLHNAPLAQAERELALSLLREGAASVMLTDPEAERVEQVDAQVVHALCTTLLELSESRPLVVLVDDVHYADRASLLCLSYLTRRVRHARVLMVFGQQDDGHRASTLFETEMLRQPHCRNLHLTPLSAGGVESMAADVVGRAAAERFAAEWHAVSGGNPLLVRALLKDHQAAARADGDEPPERIAVGDWYGESVLSCLRRTEPEHLLLAQGLAVLGGPAPLDALLGVHAATATRALRALERAGLLRDGDFRHPAARSAVLADLDPATRIDLHRRAAELSHGRGAPASVVAGHLLTASHIGSPWVVSVLEEAARQALTEGQVEPAIDYLKLAERACGDDQRRATIKTKLVRAEWRINPSAPIEHLAELTDALRRGHLRGADAVVLAKALLWHGRFEDARDVLEHLSRSGEMDAGTVWELHTARPWLRCLYPSFLPHLPPVTVEESGHAQSAIATTDRLESATALSAILTNGGHAEVVAGIERILRGSRLDDITLDTVESALLTLIYGEHARQAAPWCDLFIAEAASRCAPSRQARLAGIRAEISFRLGDLRGAEQHARLALRLIPPSSWGVAVGGPYSSLLLALTGMGRHDDAVSVVNQPVPDVIQQSRYGLHYLHARGRHYLAMDHLPAALRDFQRCGELMGAWGLDAAGLISWRVDTAEVLLRMERREEARKLIEEHLERCEPDATRAQGMGLRLLASTHELRQRPPLLSRAADVLRSGGDRYETARTLTDLIEVYHALGEFRRARMVLPRAEHLARECAAEPLIRLLARDDGDKPRVAAPGVAEQDEAMMLTEAERRVGALAAAGYTNREIAGKLYITISTVEQHLTRIYRKLDLTRRTDLPPSLEFSAAGLP